VTESLVADEVRAALSAAEDADATPAQRAEMLMEIAMGLQQEPKPPDQLHSTVTLYDKALTVCPEEMRLAGQQPFFSDKGDNRWRFASHDSVCWPYSATACGNQLVIADAGNNRILLWEAAP
jgi:hypothetical protein